MSYIKLSRRREKKRKVVTSEISNILNNSKWNSLCGRNTEEGGISFGFSPTCPSPERELSIESNPVRLQSYSILCCN